MTPGTPGLVIGKPDEDEELLDDKGQFKYRSGVGSLMYLLKHSRPELSNWIRQLSKALGKATAKHKKEMERIIHWVLNTANKGLKIAPKVQYNKDGKVKYILKGICDAAWNSDRKDGLSITGFVIFFMNVAIA